MPHTRRYLIEIKDAETDAVVICRAADWRTKCTCLGGGFLTT